MLALTKVSGLGPMYVYGYNTTDAGPQGMYDARMQIVYQLEAAKKRTYVVGAIAGGLGLVGVLLALRTQRR